MERYASLSIRGGEFRMDAEVRIVAAKGRKVTVEFQGERTDVRVGDSLVLHLTGTLRDMGALR